KRSYSSGRCAAEVDSGCGAGPEAISAWGPTRPDGPGECRQSLPVSVRPGPSRPVNPEILGRTLPRTLTAQVLRSRIERMVKPPPYCLPGQGRFLSISQYHRRDWILGQTRSTLDQAVLFTSSCLVPRRRLRYCPAQGQFVSGGCDGEKK